MAGLLSMAKRKKNVLFLTVAFLFLISFTAHLTSYPLPIISDTSANSLSTNYDVFFKDLSKLKPVTKSIKDHYKEGGKAKELFVSADFIFSKDYLDGVLDIPDPTFEELKRSHQFFQNTTIPSLIESGVKTFGTLTPKHPEWAKYHNSKGYLFIGGGKYNWLSLLGIRYFRELGATLPIEVFIASPEDYEEYYCEKILPKYNAYCNVFPSKLMKKLKSEFGISGYQYKMLALLSSKLENIFYIDSDNVPLRNLDYLFNAEAYLKNNLIFWPDAWARTTNPKYYDIASLKIGPKVRGDLSITDPSLSNFHDYENTLPNPTTETGMFMVNKTTHLKTLLMALYYNVFGPDYYYPLFTQGSAGEGDKETFIAAAHVMEKSWYQVQKKFSWIGYFDEDGHHAKSLGHFDLVVDYENYKKKGLLDYDNDSSLAKPELTFMHLSYPKYTPYLLIEKEQELVDKNGDNRRLYGGVVKDEKGRDFELHLWEIFTSSLCAGYDGEIKEEKLVGLELKFFKTDAKLSGYCEKYFLPRLKFLQETSKSL